MGILCTGFITPLKIWLQGYGESLMSLQQKFNLQYFLWSSEILKKVCILFEKRKYPSIFRKVCKNVDSYLDFQNDQRISFRVRHDFFPLAHRLCRAALQERLLTQEFNQVCVFLSSILGCPNCCLQTGHQTMDKVQPFHTLTSIRLARQFQSKPHIYSTKKLLIFASKTRHHLTFLKGNL